MWQVDTKGWREALTSGNSGTCFNMDEPGGHHAKRNRPVARRQISEWIHSQRKPSLKAANSWQQRGDGSTRHWGRQLLHSENGEISGDLYAII